MATKQTTTRQYGDIKIRLNDNMRFEVEWPEDMASNRDEPYDSYALACDAIDRREKTREAVKREKLALAVISAEGEAVTLTGIHAGHGGYLSSPAIKAARWNTTLYPDTPMVRRLLAEQARAEEEVSRLNGELYNLKLKGDSYDRKNRTINLSIKAKDLAEETEAMQKMTSDNKQASSGTTNLGALLKAKLDTANTQQ